MSRTPSRPPEGRSRASTAPGETRPEVLAEQAYHAHADQIATQAISCSALADLVSKARDGQVNPLARAAQIADLRERIVEAARRWYHYGTEAELAGLVQELEALLAQPAPEVAP